MYRRTLAALLVLIGSAGLAACGPVAEPAPPTFPPAAVALTRGPYLQNVTPDAATVVWRTAAPSAGTLAIRAAGALTDTLHAEGGPPGTDHLVRVTGLAPDTAYRYTVLADGGALGPDAGFRTAPAPGATTPFTFAVWGDSGCACAAQAAVAAAIAQSRPDLLLHVGDLIYQTGQASGYDPQFFAVYSPTLATAPVYPVLGNHDMVTDSGAPWQQVFYLPGDAGAHATRYYSFTWGNVHFLALDSEAPYDPTSAQYAWLLQDLESPAAQTATWRIAYFHQPPYSSGYGHGSTLALREAWGPLFERFGVDLVFSGHEHNYERTTPRRDYAAVGGTHAVTYVVTGGGGQTLYPLGRQAWTAAAAMVHHFVRVQVVGPHLTLDAIDLTGQVFDHAEFTR